MYGSSIRGQQRASDLGKTVMGTGLLGFRAFEMSGLGCIVESSTLNPKL